MGSLGNLFMPVFKHRADGKPIADDYLLVAESVDLTIKPYCTVQYMTKPLY